MSQSNQANAPQAPQHCPTSRERDDLELLAHGVLGPLSGFEGPEAMLRLRVPEAVAESATLAGALDLVDPEGAPLARVAVESTYDAGPLTGITGPLVSTSLNEFGAFRRLHLSPSEVRQAYGEGTVTVPVSAPLSTADLAAVQEAAGRSPILLLVLAGHGRPATVRGRPLTPVGLVRATLAAAGSLPNAAVVVVPLASHGHSALDDELERRVIAAYAPAEVVTVTGEGELSAPVAAAVDFDVPGPKDQGLVVFFTGLSGSGKSTLARALHDVLLEGGRRTVTSLDGDVVRRNLSAGLTFSKQDRETNIARIGWVAAEISRHGGVAICSPIAPFDSTRKQVRAMVADAGGAFVLVHVATPLEECERRDRKGLYARARRGEIPEFTGISSPYEEPSDATVRLDTTGRTIQDSLCDVLRVLDDQGYLPTNLSEHLEEDQ